MVDEIDGLSLRAVIAALPDPVLLLSPDLTILEASDSYLDATMSTRRELVGYPLFDMFPDDPTDPDASGVRDLRASLQRVMETRKPHAMPILRYDILQPPRLGGGFVERRWSPVNAPVLDEHERVVAIVHRVIDVTQGTPREAERTGLRP